MREVALEIALMEDGLSPWRQLGMMFHRKGRMRAKLVDIRCVQEAVGKRLDLNSCSSCNIR